MTDLLQTVFSTGCTPRKLSAGHMQQAGHSLPTSGLEVFDKSSSLCFCGLLTRKYSVLLKWACTKESFGKFAYFWWNFQITSLFSRHLLNHWSQNFMCDVISHNFIFLSYGASSLRRFLFLKQTYCITSWTRPFHWAITHGIALMPISKSKFQVKS